MTQGITITVSEGCDGSKRLVFDGSTLADSLVSRSATLRDLLDLDGEAPLPIAPKDFLLWYSFSESQAYSVKDLADVTEVASFLDDQVVSKDASQRLAVVLRRAYRKDLQAAADQAPGDTLIFPNDVLTTPGSSLQVAIASLPSLTPRAISALLRHLTLCEALVLPTPFPAMALEHYLATTNGTLDLSPPRVPAYTPRTLQRLCELLAPLLSSVPPLTGLHIPAPCLYSLEPLTPLTPALSSLTRLCITHGQVTYGALRSPRSLPWSTVAALLNIVTPSTLRHLSIAGPLKASSTDPDITRRLGTLTALTSLRIPAPQHPQPFPLQLLTLPMPSLSSLSMSHLRPPMPPPRLPGFLHNKPWGQPTSQPDRPGDVHLPAITRHLPAITRLHACGSSFGVADVARILFEVLHVGTSLQTIELVGCTDSNDTVAEPAFAALAEVFARSPAADTRTFFLSGSPYPVTPCRALSGIGVLTDDHGIQLKEHPHLQSLWQHIPLDSNASEACYRATNALMTSSPKLRCLTIITRDVSHQPHPQLKSIFEAALAGAPLLSALCVLRTGGVTPHSAVGAKCVGDAERGVFGNGVGCGWVTSRRLGVAHPICALEMLHCEGGAEDVGAAAAAADDTAPPLRTLRVSAEDFTQLIQPHIESGRAPLAALTDLSVIQQKTEEGLWRAPDLTPVARLTALNTLSLEGCYCLCATAEALSPLTRLTALALEGSEADADLARELGGYLLAFRGLQRLDVELVCDRARAGGAGGGLDSSEEAGESEDVESEALEAEFWAGVRGALRELPLALGACVTVEFADCDSSVWVSWSGGSGSSED